MKADVSLCVVMILKYFKNCIYAAVNQISYRVKKNCYCKYPNVYIL